MIKPIITLILFSTLLFFSNTAFALLENNMDGTITQTRNDGSTLMWLQDANTAYSSGYCFIPGNCFDNTAVIKGIMNWYQANNWITNLNNNNYLGYNDWRLPHTLPVNGIDYNYNSSYDGSTDKGYNITSPNNEMAYLYYVELRNSGLFDEDGNLCQTCYLINTAPFSNLTYKNLYSNEYWSDTAFTFDFNHGLQETATYKGNNAFAWAVRDVTVVPEPVSFILFATGGILLVGRTYIKKA